MQPNEYYFANQGAHEEILYVYHRHWFDILKQYFPLILMMVVLIVAFKFSFFDVFASSNLDTFILFVQSLLVLIIWIGGFMIWFDYYLDVWIITTQRVVNVEQTGLFSRKVSELRFLQIQDISTDVKGFIPTMLNYGDVHIQTAAEQSKFIFLAVPNPYEIKANIIAQQKKTQAKTFTKKKCDKDGKVIGEELVTEEIAMENSDETQV
jgi:uncharacterized membrane protein YdbT with pleckstrin-like domain